MHTIKRPLGITILGVVRLASSILCIVGGTMVLLNRDEIMQRLAQNPGSSADVTLLTLGMLVMVGLGCIGLLLAYGLFTLKGWAWICTLALQVASIINALAHFDRGEMFSWGAVAAIVIAAAIIVYLFRPNVKRAFGRH